MPLTVEELATFASRGMLIRRGLIAQELAVRARALAEDWYEREMKLPKLVVYTQRTFAPEHGSHPDLLALFYSSDVVELVTSLVSEFQPVTAAQIQIRVPERDLTQAQPEKAMHVDGVACPHLDPSELRTFSLLVGVVLSDVTNPQGGALRYVPGRSFWPGHLALTLPWRDRGVGAQCTAVGAEHALVTCDDGPLGMIASKTAVPIAATSVNVSSDAGDAVSWPAITIDEVRRFVDSSGLDVAFCLDGGICPAASHLTIVDCTDGNAQLLRAGLVHERAVTAALTSTIRVKRT